MASRLPVAAALMQTYLPMVFPLLLAKALLLLLLLLLGLLLQALLPCLRWWLLSHTLRLNLLLCLLRRCLAVLDSCCSCWRCCFAG